MHLLRDLLAESRPAIGTFLSLGSPLAAEVAAVSGFDWALVDLEHGAGGESSLVSQLQACLAHRVPAVVRVESASRVRVGRALDLGADGIMFPRLSSVEETGVALGHLRYPPHGDRGVATYHRAAGFGLRSGSLLTANDEVVSVIQIETKSAMEQLRDISRLPGVDVLFVGPRDLGYSLGVPNNPTAPAFLQALEKVAEAARDAGVKAGILASDPTAAKAYLDIGYNFIAISSDSMMLASAGREIVDAMRGS